MNTEKINIMKSDVKAKAEKIRKDSEKGKKNSPFVCFKSRLLFYTCIISVITKASVITSYLAKNTLR